MSGEIKCDYCGLVKGVPCRTPAEAKACKPGDEVLIRAFFALSPAHYDTPRARQGVQAIVRGLGPNTNVVDPSHPDHAAVANKRKLAEGCDVVILMAMPGNYVDCASALAAQDALGHGRRVYELDRDANLCIAIERLDPLRCLNSLETEKARAMIAAWRKGA